MDPENRESIEKDEKNRSLSLFISLTDNGTQLYWWFLLFFFLLCKSKEFKTIEKWNEMNRTNVDAYIMVNKPEICNKCIEEEKKEKKEEERWKGIVYGIRTLTPEIQWF